MEKKLDLILERLTSLESDISHIKADVANTDSRITNIESRVTNMESRITNIESRVTNMESKITNIGSKVTNMESKITNIESNMATKQDVAEIPAIKVAVLETLEEMQNLNESQISFHEIIGEHEISIRNFRRKLAHVE